MEMLQKKLPLTWLVLPRKVYCFVLTIGYICDIVIIVTFKNVYQQVENGFILLLEKEIFIDQLKDIVDKAEDMLSEDMEGEGAPTLSCSPQQGQISERLVGEVRCGGVWIRMHTLYQSSYIKFRYG